MPLVPDLEDTEDCSAREGEPKTLAVGECWNLLKDQNTTFRGTSKAHIAQIPGVGINTLASELLCAIFEHACSSDSAGVRVAFTFSYVCQRFRAVALRNRALWNTVTDDLPSGWVKLCLARSASLPLTVRMNDPTCECESSVSLLDIPEFIAIIRQACDRVTCFAYFLPVEYKKGPEDGYDVAARQFLYLKHATRNLSLPHLQNLWVLNEFCFDFDYFANGTFYTSWTVPRLTHFHGTNLLPSASFSCSITSFTLDMLNALWLEGHVAVLLQVLAGMKHLKKLIFRLELAEHDGTSGRTVSLADLHEPPCLEALEELTVVHERTSFLGDGFSGSYSHHLLESVFVYVDTPLLSTLSIEIISISDVFKTLREIIPHPERCPNLHTLKLKHLWNGAPSLYDPEMVDEVVPHTGILDLFALFPQIHDLKLDGHALLRLDTTSFQGTSVRGAPKCPSSPLRVLTVHGADEAFTCQMIKYVRLGQYWEEFETLRLVSYQGSLEHDLAQIRELLDGRNLELD